MPPDPRSAFAESSGGVFSRVVAAAPGRGQQVAWPVDSSTSAVADPTTAWDPTRESASRSGDDSPPPHDAAHGELLDAVRGDLVDEAKLLARRIERVQQLERLGTDGAAASVVQFAQLEMAGSWSISQLTASRWIDEAERFTTCLPLTLSMLSAGTLLVHQARVLLHRTRSCSEEVCRQVEAAVLPAGAELCPSDLRKRVDRTVLRIESAATDPATAEQRHAEAVAGRRTFTRAELDGMGLAGALLSAEQLVAWQAGLDLLERRERLADRTAGVVRSAEQRRADLFAALPAMVLAGTAQDRAARTATVHPGAAHCSSGPSCPDQSWAASAGAGISGLMTSPAGSVPLPLWPQPSAPWTCGPEQLAAQVVIHVHVPVATVLDRSSEPGTLDRYGPISAEHVRLVRPHSYRRVLVDAGSGVPLAADDRSAPAGADAVGRREQVEAMLGPPTVVVDRDEAQHDPSAALARLVDLRDAHCCGPGCSATRTDRDHLEPWPEGPTSARNLGRLSRRCHRAKHAGWTLLRHPDGRTTWTSPLGRTYTRPGPHPPPPRVDLTGGLPPLRPPPLVEPPRWVTGKEASSSVDAGPSETAPTIDDDPPF